MESREIAEYRRERPRWIPGVFETTFDGGVTTMRGVCAARYEGGPRVAHGGWTAAMMDELLGTCSNAEGSLSVTGTLTITYVRPVPIERDLVCTAWVEGQEGRRRRVRGEIRLASTGALLAGAEGIFVETRQDHFGRHEAWLAGQEGESAEAHRGA
ncbi:PaaI family thioesterase [Streptosporangium sp. NPDC002544]|uniref:PaaI family thioesterase n=1 Tax=Streptosporangium sp. NPDC002544 TaxID=3154538 RepID=UPI003325FD5D